MSLGTLRKALLAIDLKAWSGLPARICRIGFNAHTYPVTKENIVTPIRPWNKIRIIGYWRIRGGSPSAEVGLKRSSSNARAMWVKTTRMEAQPLRPCIPALDDAGHRSRGGKCNRGQTYIYPFDVLLLAAHSVFTETKTQPLKSLKGVFCVVETV